MINYFFASLLVTLWLALTAISSLVFRALGWTKLKQYPLAIAVLVLSLLGTPFGGLLMLARPHAKRIVAILRPLKSSPIFLPSGCSFSPQDNVWNTSFRNLPVDPRSSLYIETMGRDDPLHPDFGSAYGYEYSVVGGDERVDDVGFGESPAES